MQTFRYMLIPVFSTTVFAYCLFLILSFMGARTMVTYSFFAALICALVSAVINYRFALRDRGIVSIAVLNGILIIMTEFFVFSAPNDITGFWLYVIAAISFMAPIITGLMFCRNPIKVNGMMLYCECSIVGTIVLIALQIGEMNVSPLAIGVSITAMVLNLFMLSLLRISGPAKKAEAGRKGAVRGAFLLTGLVGTVFAAAVIAVFLLPAGRNAIFTAINTTRNFFVWIAYWIERFFIFLISLLPAPKDDGFAFPDMEESAAIQGEGEFLGEIDPDISKWVFIICAGAAIVALVIGLIRFRRKKVEKRIAAGLVYEEESGYEWQLLRLLLALPGRIKNWLYYQKCLFEHRGTYEEAFIRIIRRARRRGLRRNTSETPQAFLYRVTDVISCPETGIMGEHFASLIRVISAAIDRRLYSADYYPFTMLSASDEESLSVLLKAIRRRK